MEFECWGEGIETGRIFQIGICRINMHNLDIVQERVYNIGPYELSEYCTNLVKINEEDYKKSCTSLECVVESLNTDYDFHKNHWSSWGKSDLNKSIKYKIKSGEHINAKSLYDLHMRKRSRGLHKSMIKMGLTPYGEHHNVLHDAINCAIIIREFIK